MPLAAIGLGANLPSMTGPPVATIAAAIEQLAAHGTCVTRSALYRTAPVGYLDQPEFVNAAVLLDTTLAPLPLLDALLAMERRFGRDRTQGPAKGPRTLDLDLLLWDDCIVDDPRLTLPHPAMHQRRFVLEPLAEIAPTLRHPRLERTMERLLAELLQGLPPDAPAVARITE